MAPEVPVALVPVFAAVITLPLPSVTAALVVTPAVSPLLINEVSIV